MADTEPPTPASETAAGPFDAPRAFQVAAPARAQYDLSDALFAETGPLVVGDAEAAREVAGAMNLVREAPRFPERAVAAGDLAAAALIQEILRYVVAGRAGAEPARSMG
ncbi:MAG: hypothetical protein H6R33_357, partial [Actinobacteria bacterium]|nr:hypothetical protein [Actinomycetota bacterium]